jgi:hypothetical protein
MVHERWLHSMSGFGNGYRLRKVSKGSMPLKKSVESVDLA